MTAAPMGDGPPRRGGRRERERGGRPPLPPPPPVHPAEQPPAPPRELDPDPALARSFEMDGIRWVATVSGKSAAGTGGYGLAMLVAVHFAHADEPERPRYEALLPRGRFAYLHDDELRALLRHAVRIVTPNGGSRDRR